MTHSYTYILETIQPKTLKILAFKSISKMHFKCNLCFFMCLWCHYHLLSTEFRHRACFHTGAASEGTPHKPQHRQGTLSNYSPGQYSNNQGLQTLGYTWVTFTHKHSPTGVTQTSYTQKGFHNRTQSKMVRRENSWRSHIPARDMAGAGTTATSALGTAAETPRGLATGAPFTSTGQTSRTEPQHLKGWNGERKPQQSHELEQRCRGKKIPPCVFKQFIA